MVLVDTSIWIDHLRYRVDSLAALLNDNQVSKHPMVIGELACGQFKNRQTVLKQWGQLPEVKLANHKEVMFLIEHHDFMGKGIGYVDAHLLAACKLDGNIQLWTRDKRLAQLAELLNIAFHPLH